MTERRKFLLSTVKRLRLATSGGLPRYLEGRDSCDEERLKDISEDFVNKTPISSRKPEDYLNQEEF